MIQSPIPETGQIVTVRQRRYVVVDVQKSALPVTPVATKIETGQHLLTLNSIEDDALGETLQGIWEIEPGTNIEERIDVIEVPHTETEKQVHRWLKEYSRPSRSFWLQTSKGRFYPDFVCKLKDGRILVVEYKGSHLYTDAEEKLAIGELWEKRSKGKCLFAMPTNREFGVLVAMTNTKRRS